MINKNTNTAFSTPIVDLHVHSTASDGTFTPSQLVDYAVEKGLSAFALTDHDTVDGLEEAMARAEVVNQKALYDASRKEDASSPSRNFIEVIPGIELSTEYMGKDVHIVGLYIDHRNPVFLAHLEHFRESRDNRNRKMCGLLAEAGIDISYEKLLAAFPDCVITRAHYAAYLLEHGYVKSRNEAFERFVGDHCPYFVPREKVTPAQAIRLILEADGIPILAHPILYHLSDERLDTLVGELKTAGLIGIEAVYSTYSPSEERQIRRLAAKYHLLVSGGSDFHGANKPKLDLACGYGSLVIPYSILADLQKSRIRLLFSDMDGTLLRDDSTLSPSMKEALDQLTHKGNKLILTSGRPLPGILEVCEQQDIHYPNMLIIANNGAQIYDCDRKENILKETLALSDIRYLVTAAKQAGLHVHAYTDTEIVCHQDNQELQFYRRRIHMPLKCVKSIPDALEEGSCKLQIINLTDKARLEAFRNQVGPYCKEHNIQLIFSNDYYLELLPSSAGKGNGIRFLAEYLHVPMSHTYAAGDAENDISMLEAAGTGIAMANATEAVKQAADIVTADDNNHDGLLPIIQSNFI